MISFLEGELIEVFDDRVTLLVGGIGYDILIPAYLINEIKEDEKKGLKALKLHV